MTLPTWLTSPARSLLRRTNRRPAPPIIVGLFAILLAPFHLFSQSPAFDSSLLRTVVIQATRADARTPVPHTNLDAAAIRRQNQGRDVPYLLSAVPSLVETSDAGTGIGYTGLRIRGSDPTRINVTINGVPLNDAESQGVYWVNLPDLAASAAEIQVQRGVGSSTNGPGAFGATVNVDLSRIEPLPFALLSNTLGSFGTRRHALQVGTGLLGSHWAFAGRVSQVHSDGYIDRARADLRGLHLTGAYIDDRQSVQAHVLDGHEETYQAWYGVPAQYLDDPALRTFNTAGTEKPGAPYDEQVDNYTQRHYLLHYKRTLPRGLGVQLNGHYTRGFGYYEQYKAGQDLADYGVTVADSIAVRPDLVRRLWLDNHFYGLTWALRWAPSVNPPLLAGAPEFLLGGAVSRYAGKHFGDIIWSEYAFGLPKDFRYYENDADKRDANIFFKLQFPLRGGLSPFIDLQYRRVDYRFLGFDREQRNVGQSAVLHFFNPKAGLTWAFAPGWTAQGFFGIANREPNRDDYTQSTPDSRPRAERLYDLEAGVKRRGAWGFASANVFYMYYRDQLVLDGRLNDVGAYIRTNLPESYRAGLELEAACRPAPRWELSASAAWSRNRVLTFTEYRDNWDTGAQETVEHRNTDLAFSPAWIGRGEVRWQVLPDEQRHALALTLAGKYVGRQFLDNTSSEATQLPAYFTADFRLHYDLRQWLGERISLIVAVNNLFDARYANNGWVYRYRSATYDARPDDPYTRLEGDGVYHQAGFFPQAGRNVLVSVNVEF